MTVTASTKREQECYHTHARRHTYTHVTIPNQCLWYYCHKLKRRVELIVWRERVCLLKVVLCHSKRIFQAFVFKNLFEFILLKFVLLTTHSKKNVLNGWMSCEGTTTCARIYLSRPIPNIACPLRYSRNGCVCVHTIIGGFEKKKIVLHALTFT